MQPACSGTPSHCSAVSVSADYLQDIRAGVLKTDDSSSIKRRDHSIEGAVVSSLGYWSFDAWSWAGILFGCLPAVWPRFHPGN